MRHRILELVGKRRKFVLVLDHGEEAVGAVVRFCQEQGIESASLSGIGAFSRTKLGYFNPTTKEFVANEVDEQTEVLSMLGNVARDCDDNVQLHVHVVLGCRDATTRGGHLVEGSVCPTAELIIEESESHLRRDIDEETGLCLLEPRKKSS